MRRQWIVLLVLVIASILIVGSATPSFGQEKGQEKDRGKPWVQTPPVPPGLLNDTGNTPSSDTATSSSTMTAAAVAAAPTDVNSCAAAADADGFKSKTRYYVCSSWKPAWLWREGYTGGPIIGEIKGRVTFFTVADRLSRKVTITIMLDQVVLSGTADGAGLGTRVACSGGACSWSSQEAWDFAFKWASGTYKSFTYTITNTSTGGTGVELKKWATLTGSYKVNSEANPTPMIQTWATHNARCDSAAYIGGTGGCAHQNAIPAFTLSISGDGVPEAADHIRDAIEQPSTTIPLVPGKVIPAELHRTRDQAIIDANRAAARSTCNTDPAFQGIDRTGRSCDEYPFATTAEGASRGPYSVRWINETQNSLAGSKLSSFYNFNRVLDGDNFFVMISD
jgi:hypothetical protein